MWLHGESAAQAGTVQEGAGTQGVLLLSLSAHTVVTATLSPPHRWRPPEGACA